MLAGIEKVAQQSVLYQVPAVAASYAALATKGTTFTAAVATASANEKQYKASATAADLARSAFDLELDTLKTAVENNATSAGDITGMGFEPLTITKSSKTLPDAPATVSMAGMISVLPATWSMKRSIQARRASSGDIVAAKRCPDAVSFSTSLR